MSNLDSNYLDSSVRWTDKLTLCHNGDIIEDFSGKVVGHVTSDLRRDIFGNEERSEKQRASCSLGTVKSG